MPLPVSALAPPVAPSATPSAGPWVEASEPAASEAAIAPEQGVSSWAIQPGSSLRFRTTWSGEAIAGGFARFIGDVVFGPEQLAKSAVTITIDTGSVFSGDSQRDEALKGDEWFASAANRDAVFKSGTFRKTGTLRMKAVSAPVSVPFTLRITGDQATMQGSATIDRLAYKIGEGEYASTAEIPARVAVDIMVRARRK